VSPAAAAAKAAQESVKVDAAAKPEPSSFQIDDIASDDGEEVMSAAPSATAAPAAPAAQTAAAPSAFATPAAATSNVSKKQAMKDLNKRGEVNPDLLSAFRCDHGCRVIP
jgi:hypothetical protein